ncbi:MAG: RNA-guided endonuclease InsQ/TnpB family protein, partial [Thiohalorhabdaceae bacterium]
GRFVWNRALELIQTYRAWGEGVPRYNAVEAHLAQWKRVFPWLVTDGHSQALQQRLRDLDQAWAAALDPEQPDARPPRFKGRGSGDTIRFPQGVVVRGAQVKLPKIGRVRFRKSRNLPEEAEVRSVVVTRDGAHWFAHLQIRYTVPDPGYATDLQVLGRDLGVARFLTASDGTVFPALTARYERLQKRLAREQRRLARKQKGSNNRAKQRDRVAAVHRKPPT